MTVAELVNMILAVCGGISIIGGAGALIWKWVRPAVKIKDRVDKLEANAKKDYESINDIKAMNAAMCQALIAIIDHEITGNSVDGLKKQRAISSN